MSLTLLYNDDCVFAAYKPAGLHTVQLRSGGGASLADLLLTHYPDLAQASPASGDAGLIQRLDRETSGIVLGAKSREVWQKLFEELLAGSIQKTYVALVEGHCTTRRTFSSFIGSPHRGAAKVRVYENEPPKSARALPGTTVFSPLSFNPVINCSLVEAVASPARRHQVRAHAAYVGHPLVGDALYGARSSPSGLCVTQREFFLHACTITFQHPTTGQSMTLESPYLHELSDRALKDLRLV